MVGYKADGSASPQERQHSPSPDPTTAATHAALKPNPSGPSRGGPPRDSSGVPFKRAKLTQSDLQRIHLEKLLANPDKEVMLPEPVREKTLRAPHEMMKNVQGSAAGAGSGEFHVYKASRRREYERVKLMEDKGRALEEQEAFQARQDARDAIADAKTAKNRAKRQKRKGGGKKEDGGGSNGAATSQGQTGTKRKLAGGAEGFKAVRAGEEAEDDEDVDGGGEGEETVRGVGVGNLNIPIPSENGALGNGLWKSDGTAPGSGGGGGWAKTTIVEPKVVIHDDD